MQFCFKSIYKIKIYFINKNTLQFKYIYKNNKKIHFMSFNFKSRMVTLESKTNFAFKSTFLRRTSIVIIFTPKNTLLFVKGEGV